MINERKAILSVYMLLPYLYDGHEYHHYQKSIVYAMLLNQLCSILTLG